MKRSLLAVFAHPDDETYRPGGTLALLAKAGVRVQVLTATRGEAGSCGDPPRSGPGELPIIREGELRCACRELGLEEPFIMGFPDGQLSSIDPKEIQTKILEAIAIFRPQIILSFGAHGLSGHPDHIAIGRSALKAYQQCEDVLAFYSLAVPSSIVEKTGLSHLHATPDKQITHTINISEVWETKLKAIACHQTQMAESPILKADIEKLRMFLGQEHLRLVERRVYMAKPPNVDDDLVDWIASD